MVLNGTFISMTANEAVKLPGNVTIRLWSLEQCCYSSKIKVWGGGG